MQLNDAVPQNAWSPEGQFLIPPQVLQQIMAAQLANTQPPNQRRGPILPPGGGGQIRSPLPADRIPVPNTPMSPPPPPPLFDPPPTSYTPSPAPGAENSFNTGMVPGLPQLINGGLPGNQPPPLSHESDAINPVLGAMQKLTQQAGNPQAGNARQLRRDGLLGMMMG